LSSSRRRPDPQPSPRERACKVADRALRLRQTLVVEDAHGASW
jgi:hypothetical protein